MAETMLHWCYGADIVWVNPWCSVNCYGLEEMPGVKGTQKAMSLF